MHRLNFLPLLLLSFLVLSACGPEKNRVRFKGKLANITRAEFYVYSEDGAFDGIDTVRIEDGKFAYERPIEAPAILTLLYPNFTQAYIIAEPGKTIHMKGDAAKIGEAEVSGTEQNQLLTDFRLKHLNDKEGNVQMAAAQFVRDHAETLAAVAVFRKYFAQKETPDAQTALQLLDVLKKAQPKERAVSYLDKFFRPIFENGVGEHLPAFTAETIDGQQISAEAFRGKPLVIACVGSWESRSRSFLRELRNTLKQMPDKYRCLVVSLDVDREGLRQQLRTDSITFPVVCDRRAFESPLVNTLGLHYVPSLMKVDAKGKILSRDVTKVEDAHLN